jgi:hypothetical protein
VSTLSQKGFEVFAPEACVRDWVVHARQDALRAVVDPALSHWHQCQGTWFVGLEALNNDAVGRVGVSAPLAGVAVDAAHAALGHWPVLHRAQISVVYPGYPRPRDGETEAGFRYRLNRDAAHVDGVIGVGQPKRRYVLEPHAIILGFPLSDARADAAPLVVWEGSHHIMRKAFSDAFAGRDPDTLDTVDVTDVYVAARKDAFEKCARIEVSGPPGSAYLVHRLALHGVAPWGVGATAAPEGRMIAYFRPPMPGGIARWVLQD